MTKVTKVRDNWARRKKRRDPEAERQERQVKCLTSDEGHVWMPSYDELPPLVRRRLASSRFNICAACLDIDACAVASKRGQRKPSVAIYCAVIESIEQQLELTT